MAEMIERVARAIARSHGVSDANVDRQWLNYQQDARDVLNAMREPTGDMLGEVHDTLLYHVKGNEIDTARIVWARFIEASLDG